MEPVLTCKVHDSDLLLSLPLDAVVPFLFVPVVFCLTFQTFILQFAKLWPHFELE